MRRGLKKYLVVVTERKTSVLFFMEENLMRKYAVFYVIGELKTYEQKL